ncbi:C-5 sterol desaturase [Nocardia sp. SYP-A9097]|nr:C-5 sterol desaturase [Nocardia sp. SYP-A9097]
MLAELWREPVLYALPVFALSIVIEVWLLRDHDEQVTGYLARDSGISFIIGFGGLVAMAILKLATLALFVFLWECVALWHIPANTWWSWLLLMVTVDFAYYWDHRFTHRVRLGWAGHQVHHSSEYLNVGNALRLKWNPWFEAVVWTPLPLLGFAPWTIYFAFIFNLVYQFFTHTEIIGRLPRPIEYLLNTPSHHRVHHGRDPEYLDKNYGGILIIWDRLFGTYQEELHRPSYGLTKPVGTHNVLKLQYHEYGNIIRDVRGARGWRNKLGYIFAPPGWQPKDLRAPATVTTTSAKG